MKDGVVHLIWHNAFIWLTLAASSITDKSLGVHMISVNKYKLQYFNLYTMYNTTMCIYVNMYYKCN